ncbi:MAG: HD domain-containing protein [Patescibacteria group bacterium]
MNKKEIINQTVAHVKKVMRHAEPGHDWWHIYRVWQLARHIGQHEPVNMFVVELGALLHDIADFKFHDGNEKIGAQKASEFLGNLNVGQPIINHIEQIINNVSYKGKDHVQEFKSPELDVIQDADRLDALGAIGIARTFSFAGFMGNEIYNPHVPPNPNMSKEQYIQSKSTAINHFYEKALSIKDNMNTATGKKLARHRHQFLEQYLEEFYLEWEGKK